MTDIQDPPVSPPTVVTPAGEEIVPATMPTGPGFPTTADFLDPEKEAGAIAAAAYEILTVLKHLNMSAIVLGRSSLPLGSKMAYVKRMQRAVEELYLGVPNQWIPHVVAIVESELGKPEDAEQNPPPAAIDAETPKESELV